MKRILSIFLTSICLSPCIIPNNIVFAKSEDSLTEEISHKKPRSLEPEEIHISDCENQIRQKAFLIALLCATGTDVYINPVRKITKKVLNLTVSKIGNTEVEIKGADDHFSQLNALVLASRNIIDLETVIHKNDCMQNSFKINGHNLKIDQVLEYGDKFLEFFRERKQNTIISSIQKTDKNLTEDIVLRYKTELLFRDILNSQENPAVPK